MESLFVYAAAAGLLLDIQAPYHRRDDKHGPENEP
jgi:hypothetical protein